MSEYTDKFIILSNAARELIYLLNRNGIPRATLGLNSFEWEIFAFLGLGTYGMKFLSEYFQKNYSTMTGVMDRLEEKEVIVRVADKSDRRAVGIKLTEEWQQKYNELAERQERSAQITYEAITGKKFDALLKLLQETNDCMSKRFDLVETNDE